MQNSYLDLKQIILNVKRLQMNSIKYSQLAYQLFIFIKFFLLFFIFYFINLLNY